MSRTSDEQILELIHKDKHAGYSLLLKEYQRPIYYHIRQMVYRHEDADDITQEVFIKIFKNLSKFKGNAKLFTWMYRIATNEALNFLQTKARKAQVPYDDIAYTLAMNLEADVYFDGDEITLKLEKALARLPEKQRLVFQMKYYEEMKYTEISEILDTSVGALKASYHHAVKKLEKYLVAD